MCVEGAGFWYNFWLNCKVYIVLGGILVAVGLLYGAWERLKERGER